jgi:hypothetical protein
MKPNGRKVVHTMIAPATAPTKIGRKSKPDAPGFIPCPMVKTIGYASKLR